MNVQTVRAVWESGPRSIYDIGKRAAYREQKATRKRRRFLSLLDSDFGALATTTRLINGQWRVVQTLNRWPNSEAVTTYPAASIPA